MPEWYEKIFDNDYIRAYSRQSKTTVEDIDGVIELLVPSKEMKILDLCCGYGRHSLELARRGFKVTGYDLSKEFLVYAKKKANEEKLKINFTHGDIRDLDYQDEFDIILNLFTSFGYFSHEENQDVLDRVAKALVPNGRFLLQALNFSGIIRRSNIENPSIVFEGDDVLIVDTQDWDLEHNILNIRRRLFFENGDTRKYSFALRVYTLAEIIRMLEKAGLKLVDYYGTIKGTPFDFQSNHYVVITEKAL